MVAAPAAAAAAPFRPRFQLANVPLSLLIFFGMWLCWVASSGVDPLPLSMVTAPLKSVGLFFFRAEWMIRVVFWMAVGAHVMESMFAARFAWRCGAGVGQIAAWTIQTAMVGYPSLKLIKAQRREQLRAIKAQAK